MNQAGNRTARPRVKPLTACLALALGAGGADAIHARPAPERPAGVVAVTSCEDDGGTDTLRHAIETAADGDEIDLSPLACGAIVLTAGELAVFVDNLAIIGPGKDALTIDANHASRVLAHDGAGTLRLRGLTLTHGRHEGQTSSGGALHSEGSVRLDDVLVTDSVANGSDFARGGGVFAQNGIVAIRSTISGNESRSPYIAAGGGLTTGDGDIELVDSVVTGNTATGEASAVGGGLRTGSYDLGGNITLLRSRVTDNAAIGSESGGEGGGLYTSIYGDVTVVDSTISGNTVEASGGVVSGEGGGGAVWCGGLTLIRSTLSGNTATEGGGFILGSKQDRTGLTIVNSTISGNHATDRFGGGRLFDCALTMTGLPPSEISLRIASSTITGNDAGQTFGGLYLPYAHGTLDSTIIHGNTVGGAAVGGPEDEGAGTGVDLFVTEITGGANNLVGDVPDFVVLPDDTISDDPLLGPLADNGGPTQTHAPGAGSPAIDAGNNTATLVTDQRGGHHVRGYGAAPDIGALEVQPAGGAGGQTERTALHFIPALGSWALGLLAVVFGLVGARRGR